MNSKWIWAVALVAALVLVLSHYAVWEWRAAKLKLEWMDADRDTVVTIHTDTLYLRDTVQAVQYVAVTPPIPKPVADDSATQAEVDTVWDLLVRIGQPAREVLDTLGVEGTVDYEPFSRTFYNNLLLKRGWADTTVTQTVLSDHPWSVRDLAIGAMIGGIIFSLLILWMLR